MDTPINKQAPRDVFLYLLMMFVLASSATALGTILFQLINLWVPGDVGYNYIGSISGTIRFAVSSLVIMFPVLFWVVHFLKRDIAQQPFKQELKIRKWLLYFALFIAGLTVIGDLVTLVYTFMQGDLTLRFILKVIVVLWLAGSVFYYYLKDLHGTDVKGRRIIEWVTTVLVAAALITGFVVAGSPASQRARANDDRRVSDLQSIEGQVITYWQDKGVLPASLSDLPNGTLSGFVVPVDPSTGVAYEYRVTKTLGYELCATFESTSDSSSVTSIPSPYGFGVGNWQHSKGRQCFDGVIDPQRFPTRSPKLPM